MIGSGGWRHSCQWAWTMKTVLILTGLVALAAGSFPLFKHEQVATKKLDENLIEFQRKALSLFENVIQVWETEYYTIGKEYDIEKNKDKYSNPEAVQAFLGLWNVGITPKFYLFSIFQERQKEEAVIVYELLYSAKDFDTLYKTAAWAKVHLNEGMFLYSFYTALFHRPDTHGIVLPSPYELWPQYFVNMEAMYRMVSTQLLHGEFSEEQGKEYGIFKQDKTYYYYYNYSDSMSYDNNEHRLAYFTEDIGWNSFYYYFHTNMPFWSEGDQILGPFKERRGEIYYYFYQQLLSRYYLERLSNGLGEIPKFSWFAPLKVGYYPYLSKYFYPFAQRNNYYYMGTPENEEYIQFVDTYEKSFLQFIQTGQFQAVQFKQEVDFRNSKSINFVGNFWQGNPDLYEKEGKSRNYDRSYEQVARQLLGGAPQPYSNYMYVPSALNFYQTSMRDPVFYQLYAKIMNYIVEYKEWLEPYTQDDLHYVGVKINDIKVDELVTFFEYYDFNVTRAMYAHEKPGAAHNYFIRQPRLNHKPFSVTFDVKSDVESEVVIKLFMAPKYDGEGRPLTLEDNWLNFVELDWFTHKLTSGQNKIERNCEDFFFYREDSVSTRKIVEFMKQGLVPEDMSEDYDSMPIRLMLPRGNNGGFPVQFFAFIYPYEAIKPEYKEMQSYVVDNKPFGYPFDRPVPVPHLFYQPNMYFEDVSIYHQGPEYPWWSQYNHDHQNSVPKH